MVLHGQVCLHEKLFVQHAFVSLNSPEFSFKSTNPSNISITDVNVNEGEIDF